MAENAPLNIKLNSIQPYSLAFSIQAFSSTIDKIQLNTIFVAKANKFSDSE